MVRNAYWHVQYNKWESMCSCLASSSWWLSINLSLTTTSSGFPAPSVSKQLPAPEERERKKTKTGLLEVMTRSKPLLFMDTVTSIQQKMWQSHHHHADCT